MSCNQCGRRNAKTANFCTGCGTSLHADPETATRGHPVVELPLRGPGVNRPAHPTHPTLLVHRGPNVGSRYALAPGITTIGRSAAATIFLNDISVSRRHAIIENDGGRCVVTDENSLNGTYLNGRRIDPRARLSHGDELQIGLFRIVYLTPEHAVQPADLR